MFDRAIRIETPRLALRAFTEGDRLAVFDVMSDEAMSRYTPDGHWTDIEAADSFLSTALWLYGIDHETFRHFFAVTDRRGGELIGMCGIGGIEFDHHRNEVFYHIAKRHWGRGYATEAATAMLEYGFLRLGLVEIIGAVHTENIASQRVLEKIGLRPTAVIDGLPDEFRGFNGELLYVMTGEEYRKMT